MISLNKETDMNETPLKITEYKKENNEKRTIILMPTKDGTINKSNIPLYVVAMAIL